VLLNIAGTVILLDDHSASENNFALPVSVSLPFQLHPLHVLVSESFLRDGTSLTAI